VVRLGRASKRKNRAWGDLFHVLNRGVGRMQMLPADADCEAFHRAVDG